MKPFNCFEFNIKVVFPSQHVIVTCYTVVIVPWVATGQNYLIKMDFATNTF